MSNKTANLSRSDYLLLAAMGIAAFAILFVSTMSGMGLSLDSFDYIHAARNLVAGRGLNSNHTTGQLAPFTHFPPLYPLSLAVLGLFGIEPLVGARVLNLFCFMISVVFAGLIVRKGLGSNRWFMLLACFLMMTSINMIKIFSFALSEPLFIMCMMLGIYSLASYLQGSNRRFLLATGVCAALAVLTRYVGVAMIGLGLASLTLLQQSPFQRRAADALLFALISVLPISAYIVRNVYVAGTMANRTLAFHPIPTTKLLQFIDTIAGWLIPRTGAPWVLKLFAVLSAVGLCAVGLWWSVAKQGEAKETHLKDKMDKNSGATLLLLFTCVMFYIASLVIPLLFLDSSIPLNYRILAPLFPVCLILAIGLLSGVLNAINRSRSLRLSLTIICLAFVGMYAMQGGRWALNNSQGMNRDYNYNNRAWQQSGLLAALSALPSGLRIYTNEPQAVHFHLGRPATGLPGKFNTLTGQVVENFSTRLNSVEKQIQQRDAVIAYFRLHDWPHLPSEDDLAQLSSLIKLKETNDGALYGSEALCGMFSP